MVNDNMERDFNLLPPASNGLLSMVSTILENSTGSHSFQSSKVNEGTEFFNFSLQEAYQILREHQSSERLLMPGTEVALILVYSVLMTSGVVSNALVCFVVGRQCARKRLSNTGPTPRNLYIVNLAIADMALCLICMPFTLVSLLRRRWTLGLVLCKLVPVLQGANISVSAGTITAIALDRYFTIVRPSRSQVFHRAAFSVASVISLIWGVSFLSMLPLLFYQEVETVKLGDLVLYEACLEKWPSRTWQYVYTICLMVVQFLVPFLVLSVIHTKISAYLSVRLSTPRDNTCKRAKREWRRNRRTMIILSCIAIVFAVSWLPMTAFNLAMELDCSFISKPSTLYLVFAVCHIMAMSSACTNPLLYGWLNTNFRREISGIFRSRRNTEDPQQPNHDKDFRHTNRNSVCMKQGDRRISLTFFTTLTSNRTTSSSHTNPTINPQSALARVNL
ncbi:neuropeptide Y receptor type 2-like [Lycorma delicatula]|uniref:neuropeptide Y receptor type 2-like n=1 Tax=Lycorma delicatula TaxID=130591 RepID=UPI003F50E581